MGGAELAEKMGSLPSDKSIDRKGLDLVSRQQIIPESVERQFARGGMECVNDQSFAGRLPLREWRRCCRAWRRIRTARARAASSQQTATERSSASEPARLPVRYEPKRSTCRKFFFFFFKQKTAYEITR